MVDGSPSGGWRRGVDLAKDVGEYAKLVALLLAVLGFVAAYFPSARRQFERLTNPTAWYFIGGAYGEKFGHYDYQNPLWDNGPVPISSLTQLPGSIVVTTKSNEPHNGRDAPGSHGALITVVPENTCLSVRNVQLVSVTNPRQNGPQRAVWAEAQRVTC